MKRSKLLWIDLQPSLHCLFKRTTLSLGQQFEVKRWSFEHDLDESCDVDVVHSLLRQTIEKSTSSLHLVGHGLSGTIAFLYAQKYPKNISSVSLLSVDILSSNQWSSHYQTMRSQLPCSRFDILSHLSRLLINTHSDHAQTIVTGLLKKCLDNDFVQGSIIQTPKIENLGRINMPTLVINAKDDFVVDRSSFQRWQQYLKPGDCYQEINNGRHFFPFSEWRETSKMIESFIAMVPEVKQDLTLHSCKNLSIINPNS